VAAGLGLIEIRIGKVDSCYAAILVATYAAKRVTASVAATVPKPRDYVLMAAHHHGEWVFNPPDEHLLHAGTALVLMTSPGGRIRLEQALAG